jgi:phytoene desaturase
LIIILFFFDEDIEKHGNDIYENPIWPEKPLFYACCSSKTDEAVAPQGKENLFILIPIAAGLEDSNSLREKYFEIIMNRLEKFCNLDIRKNIEYNKSYCINDFKNDYNSFKGNAYGLANTLSQTANLKPKIINKKVRNLYYTGQLTVPGPGVPPSLISGKIVADYIIKNNK